MPFNWMLFVMNLFNGKLDVTIYFISFPITNIFIKAELAYAVKEYFLGYSYEQSKMPSVRSKDDNFSWIGLKLESYLFCPERSDSMHWSFTTEFL